MGRLPVDQQPTLLRAGVPDVRFERCALHALSMPSSIQEILDQADELATRFEDYGPAEGDQVPVEEHLL